MFHAISKNRYFFQLVNFSTNSGKFQFLLTNLRKLGHVCAKSLGIFPHTPFLAQTLGPRKQD